MQVEIIALHCTVCTAGTDTDRTVSERYLLTGVPSPHITSIGL